MHEKVTYKEAIVSFIDILGFKGLVALNTASEIYELCHLFQDQYAAPNLTNSEERSGTVYSSEVYFFSDSVVRIKYDDAPDNTAFNAATEEVMSLARMQWNLLERGVFVRGGVTKGPIFSDPNRHTLFGPALVDAYFLESSRAAMPRIVVSENVMRDFHADMFSPPFYLRWDSGGNRWASRSRGPLPGLEEPWWINCFWGPFADSILVLNSATTGDPERLLVQKRYIESLVCDLLAVTEKIAVGDADPGGSLTVSSR